MPEFGCPRCDRVLRSRAGLLGHLRLGHGSDLAAAHREIQRADVLWRCPLCEDLYSTKGNLRRHIRDVEGENPDDILDEDDE